MSDPLLVYSFTHSRLLQPLPLALVHGNAKGASDNFISSGWNIIIGVLNINFLGTRKRSSIFIDLFHYQCHRGQAGFGVTCLISQARHIQCVSWRQTIPDCTAIQPNYIALLYVCMSCLKERYV